MNFLRSSIVLVEGGLYAMLSIYVAFLNNKSLGLAGLPLKLLHVSIVVIGGTQASSFIRSNSFSNDQPRNSFVLHSKCW